MRGMPPVTRCTTTTIAPAHQPHRPLRADRRCRERRTHRHRRAPRARRRGAAAVNLSYLARTATAVHLEHAVAELRL